MRIPDKKITSIQDLLDRCKTNLEADVWGHNCLFMYFWYSQGRDDLQGGWKDITFGDIMQNNTEYLLAAIKAGHIYTSKEV